MAETPVNGVNGNYTPQHAFNADQNHTNHYAPQPAYPQAPSTSSHTSASAPAGNQNAEIPKDEVGWYFVEQYYTTLSKTPDRLFLYYNKRSQFVSGNETDKTQVCLGQRAISERMKELDFQDCKVRITNVDSQASDQNIVIQVIGEISNKSQPHRKFTQTFVLATQTNGYFVLNDIFRYLIEEEDEIEAEPQTETGAQIEAPKPAVEETQPDAAPAQEKPKTLTSSTDPAAVEQDAQHVDKTIEKKLLSSEVNGDAEASPVIPPAEISETPERPTEPEPTPAASPPKQAPAQPAAPAAPKPVIPKTWANLAASANKTPGAPKAAAQAAPAAPRQPPSKPAAAPTAPAAASAPVAPAAAREEAPANDSTDEWTAVGGNHNRQQSRQVNNQQQHQPQQPAGPQRRGFIKNVNENVTLEDLKEALEKVSKVVDCDISRVKVGTTHCVKNMS